MVELRENKIKISIPITYGFGRNYKFYHAKYDTIFGFEGLSDLLKIQNIKIISVLFVLSAGSNP